MSAAPEQVHARGGDGQLPLHFSASVRIAAYLLDHGAEIDARDIDHESTAAQWMLKDRPDVARYLVSRGCRTDILMAAALGDLELVRRHLDSDPASIRTTVSDRYFPKQNPRSGGSIYIYTLGTNQTPHQLARAGGHDDVFRLLMDRSPLALQFTQSCLIADSATVNDLLAGNPDIVATLSGADLAALVSAAMDSNLAAVQIDARLRMAGRRTGGTRRDGAALGGVSRRRTDRARAVASRRAHRCAGHAIQRCSSGLGDSRIAARLASGAGRLRGCRRGAAGRGRRTAGWAKSKPRRPYARC